MDLKRREGEMKDLTLDDAINFFAGVGAKVIVFDENSVHEVTPAPVSERSEENSKPPDGHVDQSSSPEPDLGPCS